MRLTMAVRLSPGSGQGWAHLLIELSRREVVVHDGGLEACVGHGTQEAAALVRECRHMLLDVRALRWKIHCQPPCPQAANTSRTLLEAPICSIWDASTQVVDCQASASISA